VDAGFEGFYDLVRVLRMWCCNDDRIGPRLHHIRKTVETLPLADRGDGFGNTIRIGVTQFNADAGPPGKQSRVALSD
jgi:hypothetical protein